MKKTGLKFFILILIAVLIFSISNANAGFLRKKQDAVLILTSNDPDISKAKIDDVIAKQYFKVNSKIYFVLYNPEGFKSDYIKYQIVKQNPNAHVGGFQRIRNITSRIKDKSYFKDYFTLSESGKYFIQVFDIENLQHWIAISSFIVVGE